MGLSSGVTAMTFLLNLRKVSANDAHPTDELVNGQQVKVSGKVGLLIPSHSLLYHFRTTEGTFKGNV